MSENRQLPATQEQAPSLFPVPLQELKQLAEMCSESGYFEGANKPAQAMVKIMKGHELGMSPMEAMESIYVCKGKTGLHANNVAARIKASAVYDYEILEINADVCRLKFFKNGKPLEGEAAFTYKEAVEAGFTESNRRQYSANRENMLFNRAVMRGYRRYCPEIYRLPVYSREELDEIIDAEKVSAVSEKAAAKDAATQILAKAGQRKKAEQKAPEPEPAQVVIEDAQVLSSDVISETAKPTMEADQEAGAPVPAPESPANDDDDLIEPASWGRLIQAGQPLGWNSLDIERLCAKRFNLPAEDSKAITNKQARQVNAVIQKVSPEKAGVRA